MSQLPPIDRAAGNHAARIVMDAAATIPEPLRPAIFRALAAITEEAESEQLIIAAAAIEQAREAQMLLFEMFSSRPIGIRPPNIKPA